jgi:signal transduction histidine kinase
VVPSEPVRLLVDKTRFLQILSNLINNAIKFTPEQGQIALSLDPREEGCRFSVQDSGPGIPKMDIPKLFQKFQQLRRTHGPGAQGTGLGLSIMKSLVELHGGQVEVESELGKGTTFIFIIPSARMSRYQEKSVYAG